MTVIVKIVVFVIVTGGIFWVSRASLVRPGYHGFYRTFAWEIILLSFLLNMDYWFLDPYSVRQLFSWSFLTLSLVLIVSGVMSFHRLGGVDQRRVDPSLVGIEKTTILVTQGIYRYIRHPFYSSLLFLGWGIILKQINWVGLLLGVVNTLLLLVTARKEESENIQFFGDRYLDYMGETKMFIPFIL